MAKELEKAQNQSKNIVFVIGGAYGVDEHIKSRANLNISFGRAVFPHQLVRVMLLEQLYRAHSILAGSGYHHV
ncbi:23S rRNA (pseudouridine(1915)-N(3))-methyltransferase RlmH [Candidatus Saccharibacteria bacterium]|nr:23S rRNA (pseudouridine(1915)-N(3))-methyltransferase RlmH [Candidatus Saccharibacteria bacterium]